ncbi:MAG: winged helix-turn-helix domain-containing protein [Ktedonobacterales bacterium]|nr:winged helix-turn-helix domain-containing protein [Ktedonobacterales bacterium]
MSTASKKPIDAGKWRNAEVIWRTFGMHYDPDHVSRLLRQAGWSMRRPIRQATQRDEKAIQRWYEERWPALERSDRGWSSGYRHTAVTSCRRWGRDFRTRVLATALPATRGAPRRSHRQAR